MVGSRDHGCRVKMLSILEEEGSSLMQVHEKDSEWMEAWRHVPFVSLFFQWCNSSRS